MKEEIILNGFGFSGYRSFDDGLVKIAPLKKMNLIIGKNNVGKSNIVNFLKYQYDFFRFKALSNNSNHKDATFHEIDKPISKREFLYKIAFPILKSEIENYILQFFPSQNEYRCRDALKKLFLSESFSDENGNIWFTYSSLNYNAKFQLEVDVDGIFSCLTSSEWQLLWSSLTKRSGGDIRVHWIPDVLKKIAYIPDSSPPIEVIPAIRKIGAEGTKSDDFSGEGIIERLAKIQNPSLSDIENKKKFISINKFLQEVLENDSAKIEIPYERDMILVEMDNKTLPLDSLGTGVHEVIILAAASTLLENTIVCVEEPELHLHPLLQRKLVKYLAEKTNNQYFLTTHSAHLLDAVESEIFHVTHLDGSSKVNATASTKERSSICNDLGYKASDILQANCIIWVEGPSDRIYLNFWISAMNPNLVEGIHYSIMFYGGRLFSHLSANDKEENSDRVEDFISIRKLNRNAVIMFDSDKSSSHSRLNATKLRLRDEFNLGPGFAWVTKGREVENYLDYNRVEYSVKEVHPSAEKIISKGIWENLLKYKKIKVKTEVTASKVKVAKHYVENNLVDFSALDLRDRVDELCNFIMKVNEG